MEKNSNTGKILKRVKKYVRDTFCLTYEDGLRDKNTQKIFSLKKISLENMESIEFVVK